MKKDDTLRAIEEIYIVAKKYDSGERQYSMTDFEYIVKQCEKVLFYNKQETIENTTNVLIVK